jgi:transcriptional regulator with XRE-family HTH domain
MRQWREYKDMTLEAVGEAVNLSHAQLGRIERGLQPYNQELLEALADLYGTTPASLLMRDPTQPDSMWSLWDQAKEAERQETEKFLEFRVRTRTGT